MCKSPFNQTPLVHLLDSTNFSAVGNKFALFGYGSLLPSHLIIRQASNVSQHFIFRLRFKIMFKINTKIVVPIMDFSD